MPAEGRAVLLDALGTLLALEDPGPRLAEALRCERGVELTHEQAERAFGAEMAYYRDHHLEGCDAQGLADLRRACAEVLRLALPASVARAISAAELEPLMLGALRFLPYPEVPAVLAVLRARGLRLVAVSNWDISLHEVLRETGLTPLLDAAITSAEVGHSKPAPEIFGAGLRAAGVSPERALHVGDSPECDVAGALGAGIAAALLRRPAAGEREAKPPALAVAVMSSLGELPALVALQ